MRLETRIRSLGMRALASQRFLKFKRTLARVRGTIDGKPSAVHYFHQVDDPYSFLVVQHLPALIADYNLPLHTHLISNDDAAYQGDAERFAKWAYNDASSIAPFYGESLPQHLNSPLPTQEKIAQANKLLAAFVGQPNFPEQAMLIGRNLWQNIDSLEPKPDAEGDDRQSSETLKAGNLLIKKLGHYRGGVLYFEGEWFWGVDRIHLLRKRLADEGFAKDSLKEQEQEQEQGRLTVGLPTTAKDMEPLKVKPACAKAVTLEYFPSLRSPYTAIGHQAVVDLIAHSGVELKLRPVMPMLMRGIPAPRDKQQYIITDCAREARAKEIPFGNFVDPFGDPVKRAFALYPGALSLGRGLEFISAYLAACFAQGIDIDSEKGLRVVVGNAGLDWTELHSESAKFAWENILEDNLQNMLGAGLWGVPSFRISGGSKEGKFSCWGQDRIWRVEHEIALRSEHF